jgi:hypothetical protein
VTTTAEDAQPEAEGETWEAAPPRTYIELFLSLAGGANWSLPTPSTSDARKKAAAYAKRHRERAMRVHPARIVVEAPQPGAKPIVTVLRQTLDRARPITTRGSSRQPLSLQQAEALGYAGNSGHPIGAALLMAFATSDRFAARDVAGAAWDDVLREARRARLATHAQARHRGIEALEDVAMQLATGQPYVARTSTGIVDDAERRLYVRYARLCEAVLDTHAGQAAMRALQYLRGS